MEGHLLSTPLIPTRVLAAQEVVETGIEVDSEPPLTMAWPTQAVVGAAGLTTLQEETAGLGWCWFASW